MAGRRPASAAEVGRGAALGTGGGHGSEHGGGVGVPPGYVSIPRRDLYRSALEGSTWHMLGSVSAAEYVGSFYPDVGLADTSLPNDAVEPVRRRPNARLSANRPEEKTEARGAAKALEPSAETVQQARTRDGPRLSTNAEEANALGTAAVRKGEHARALQLFDEGLESGPEPDLKSVLLTNRSSTYAQTLQFHDALKDAEESIILEPGWSRAHLVKGAALVGLGRKSEAIMSFEKAVELDPADAEAKLSLRMEKANIPDNVRGIMQRVAAQKSAEDGLGESHLSASSKAVSIINAMEDKGYGRRQLIIESISVENLPGDMFGLCKPFLTLSVGDHEIKTKVLTTQGGDTLTGNLEKIGFEPGVSCKKESAWNDIMVLEFDKGEAINMTIRVMEAERVGWDEETGAATVPLRVFSHSLKEHACTLLKGGQPVMGHGGRKHAQVRIMARVPAVVDDGPVGVGVCFLMRGDSLVVDSLSTNYLRRDGVDPKHGDKVISIDGVLVQGLSLAHVVALTMGPLGSSCRLEFELADSERVEAMLERSALDVPEPDYLKTDAFVDDDQMALLMPSQVLAH